MSWLPVIALAGALFLVAALALRLPRTGWAAFGAALLFGLAGYAFQASPGMPSAPKAPHAEANETSSALIEARRAMFDPSTQASDFVVMADGFARRGQFGDAAQILRGVVRDDQRHAEAWVALGNALVEHAAGNLTPAAVYAFGRAEKAAPGHPAAPYFLGIAFLRAGRIDDTRALWAQTIADAPEGADWVASMQERLDRLDAMIAAIKSE